MELDAVFSGGGVKGIALVGAISVFEKEGYQIIRHAGTSAGAIVAGLHAAGYSAEELLSIWMTVNLRKRLLGGGGESEPSDGYEAPIVSGELLVKDDSLKGWDAL